MMDRIWPKPMTRRGIQDTAAGILHSNPRQPLDQVVESGGRGGGAEDQKPQGREFLTLDGAKPASEADRRLHHETTVSRAQTPS